MDENKDGFISYLDWKSTIKDDSKLNRKNMNIYDIILIIFVLLFRLDEHLLYIKDVIYKRKLHTDDVLKTMGLDREHPVINIL